MEPIPHDPSRCRCPCHKEGIRRAAEIIKEEAAAWRENSPAAACTAYLYIRLKAAANER